MEDPLAGARTFFAASLAAGTDDEMMVQIDPDLLHDPQVSGLMIAEWMKHLAAAHVQAGQADDADAALHAILGACLGQFADDDTNDDAPGVVTH